MWAQGQAGATSRYQPTGRNQAGSGDGKAMLRGCQRTPERFPNNDTGRDRARGNMRHVHELPAHAAEIIA
jgi:hypothetical protein